MLGVRKEIFKIDKIELVQKIGNEVCEDCGLDSDCGITPSDCDRVKNASVLLDEYLSNKYIEPTTKKRDGAC